MSDRIKVVCLGEVLVDFISTEVGVSIEEAPSFVKASGGAVANVAVALARLGVDTVFISKVGDDEFGHFLINTLKKNRVHTGYVILSGEYQTGLVFASLDAERKPHFSFFGNPSADMTLTSREISDEPFQPGRWFHFGTVSMSREPARGATIYAADLARARGMKVSFDPNLRLHLYKDHNELRDLTRAMIAKADLLKLNNEEMEFLLGTDDLESGAQKLLDLGPQAVVITLGPQGACCESKAGKGGVVPGFKVKAVDTTGAGDGFMAGLLASFIEQGEFPPGAEALRRAVRFANAVAALSTTRVGAVSALPTREEVEVFLRKDEG